MGGAVESAQLDLIFANEAARAPPAVTENNGPNSVLTGVNTWCWGDHVPLWVAITTGAPGLELDFASMGTYMATLSRARWARAGDAERDELQRLIAIRTGPIVKELVANGLAKWGGSWEMAARELVAVWVKCETDAIGRSSRGKGKARRPRGPVAVEKAEESLALASAELQVAVAGGDAAKVSRCASRRKGAQEKHDAEAARAVADRISGIFPAAPGDYGGLRDSPEVSVSR